MGSSIVHFGEAARDIGFAIRHNHRDYQERVRQLGLTAEKSGMILKRPRRA